MLSIIVPVYNVEAYVGQCLNSILSTTVDSSLFELIVVNDGTKDSSMSIVKRICANRDNVRILEQENQGLSAARMNGLALAQGDYVWFIDSDDWLEDNSIEFVIDHLQESTPDVLVLPLFWRYPDCNDDHLDIEENSNIVISGKSFLQSKYPLWAAQRCITLRALFDNEWLLFPLGLLHEDEYFCKVLYYIAKDLLVVPQPIYNYRQRGNSITTNISMRSAYDLISVYKKLIVFFDNVVAKEDFHWYKPIIVQDILLSCYNKTVSLFGTKEFAQFEKINRKFILSQYISVSKIRLSSIGDLLFLRFPILFTRAFGYRWINLNKHN